MSKVAASIAKGAVQQTNRKGRSSSVGGEGIPSYVWGILGGSAAVLGCAYFSFTDVAPVTQRRRWIATSPEWERQLGDHEYEQLLTQFKGDILPSNHRASVTLHRVGRRISEAALTFAKRHKVFTYIDKPYTYTVVRSEEANAFVLPGNHVFLMTGLFRYVKDEDELAMILGHEVAHNVARHVGEKISGSVLLALLARLSLLMDPSGVTFAILLPAVSVFRQLPNSRTQEMEADQIGLQIATEACYDPRSAKRVFSAMTDESMEPKNRTAAPPEFLSTHPSHDTRIRNFDTWAPQAMIGDSGHSHFEERCREVREKMRLARKAAAVDATRRGL
jgi:metalloendopeptidase OMA1, mitochondrial